MVGTYNFQFSLLLVNYDHHPPSHCSKIVNLPVIPGPTVLRNHVCWMLHPFSNSLWPIAHPLSKLMKKTYVMQLSDWQKVQGSGSLYQCWSHWTLLAPCAELPFASWLIAGSRMGSARWERDKGVRPLRVGGSGDGDSNRATSLNYFLPHGSSP